MKTALAIFAAAALCACAHGRTGMLPPPPDPAAAARVVVIRNDNLFDWGIAVAVRVDGIPAAHLRAGEHVSLAVAPGLREIAVASSAVTIAAEAGQVYYCLIGAGDSPGGFEVERLDAGRGRGWVEKTRPLP
jgi:hypothetical protein